MKQLSTHQMVYLLHVVFVGPLLVYVGLCGAKCNTSVFTLLLALGLGVMMYHAYNLVNSLAKEGFMHPGGYLGRPEAFVPFSFPYNKESEQYYSYHDKQHTRGCNCQHDGVGCDCACHNKHEMPTTEGFMLPPYGMNNIVPNM